MHVIKLSWIVDVVVGVVVADSDVIYEKNKNCFRSKWNEWILKWEKSYKKSVKMKRL